MEDSLIRYFLDDWRCFVRSGTSVVSLKGKSVKREGKDRNRQGPVGYLSHLLLKSNVRIRRNSSSVLRGNDVEINKFKTLGFRGGHQI